MLRKLLPSGNGTTAEACIDFKMQEARKRFSKISYHAAQVVVFTERVVGAGRASTARLYFRQVSDTGKLPTSLRNAPL